MSDGGHPGDATAPARGVPAEVTTTVTITLHRKRHVVTYVAGDTLLETGRRAGLHPPSSCEQGHCATCMALLTTGTAAMRVNDALDDDEVAEGWVLTCQAIPAGTDVAVDYDAL